MPRPLLALLIVTAFAHGLEIHVTPGSAVSSLAAARDAVRKARASGDHSEARVVIAAGTYPLREPVVFESQDGHVIYEAAQGARPLFTGGVQIGSWREVGGAWVTKVDPELRFEALWVNGKRARRARHPNAGYVQAIGQPLQLLPGTSGNGSPDRMMLQVEPKAVQGLEGLTPEELREVNAIVHFSWDEQRHRVAAVRTSDGTLQFTSGLKRAFFSLEPFHHVFLENFRAALDAPGEWFLALDGTLTYLPQPDERLREMEAWAPVAAQWLILKGDPEKEKDVQGLRFRGLRFAHQAWTLPPEGAGLGQAESSLGAAIEADAAHDVAFEDCELSHTMTYAAWFRRGCDEIAMRRCHLHDLGAGGVKVGETTVPTHPADLTSRVTIENCIIHGGGRYFPAGIGIWVAHSPDNIVRHCDIADFYYSTISIGWTWGYKPTPCARNLVEYCHLHHFGWGALSDMAGVYTLGPQPGTAIRGCHVHDVAAASYGGWGLYNDEGSTGIVWENNLVHRTQHGAYHQHYGRGNVVRNNILAFNHEVQVRWSKPEQFLGFAFERNIVVFTDGKLFGHLEENWFSGHVWTNRNVYWKSGGDPFEFAGKTWPEWQFFGHDPESIVADPLFVAPAEGDWTLRPESPALKIGFQSFDWRRAGVTGDADWKRLAGVKYPPVTFPEKPKPRPLVLSEDFESTPLGAKPQHGARANRAEKTISIVNSASRGERGLEMRDGPDVLPQFEPHFYYVAHHESGVTRVSFDVKLEPGYVLNHEWRDDAEPYRTGPQLLFEDGFVKVNGRKLTSLPAGVWARVEMMARLGEGSDATWSCTVTVTGQQPQVFHGLRFVKADLRKVDWIGWSSNGKARARVWLDQIEIENAAQNE